MENKDEILTTESSGIFIQKEDDLICAQTIFFFYLLSNAFREISYMVLKGILCYL